MQESVEFDMSAVMVEYMISDVACWKTFSQKGVFVEGDKS